MQVRAGTGPPGPTRRGQAAVREGGIRGNRKMIKLFRFKLFLSSCLNFSELNIISPVNSEFQFEAMTPGAATCYLNSMVCFTTTYKHIPNNKKIILSGLFPTSWAPPRTGPTCPPRTWPPRSSRPGYPAATSTSASDRTSPLSRRTTRFLKFKSHSF